MIQVNEENQSENYHCKDCINLVACLFNNIVSNCNNYFISDITTTIIQIPKSELIKELGKDFSLLLIKSYFEKRIINNTEYKSLLNYYNMQNIFNCFEIKEYSPGEVVYNHRKTENPKIVFILSGKLSKKHARVHKESSFKLNIGTSESNLIYIEKDNSKKSVLNTNHPHHYRLGHDLSNKNKILNTNVSISTLPEEVQEVDELIAKEGDTYGFGLINSNEDLDYCLITPKNMLCLETTWENIVNKFISKKENLQIYNRIRKLRKNPIFTHIDECKLGIICSNLEKEYFNIGDEIIKEGETSNGKLYFILCGKALIRKLSRKIKVLGINSVFGNSIFISNTRLRTVECLDDLECYSIHIKILINALDSKSLELMKNKTILFDSDIKLDNLKYCKDLGAGNFGKVFLVKNQLFYYALKTIQKSKISSKHKKLLKREKKILTELDHPFIVKLVQAYHTSKHVFFLMENIDGCTLSDYYRFRGKRSLQNIELTTFYSANLILALNYLNNNQYVHRDLKPENIIIDLNGYLKLIDFGVCKKICNYTKTLVGTPHYMAPEIILGEEYDYSVDYWSLAINMYEFFYGIVPFGNNCTNPKEIYIDIVEM